MTGSKIQGRSYMIMVMLWLTCLACQGQRMLLLEIRNEVKAVKFGEGSKITFTTKTEPGEWKTEVIERIIPEQNMLITENGMVELPEIVKFRTVNKTARAFGQLFQGFGTGWLVFGGLALITGQNSVKPGHLVIGLVAYGVGWLFKKIASNRTYDIGKNANLRIIDINFTPSGEKIP